MIVALLQQPAQQGNVLFNYILMMVVLLGIMWLLLIRPQRKRERERQEMLGRLSKNDKVLTVGGIYGSVRWVKGDDVMLLVDESANIKLRMSRSAIARILSEEKEEGELSE